MEKTHTLKNLIVIDITDIPATQLSLLQALLPYEACYNKQLFQFTLFNASVNPA